MRRRISSDFRWLRFLFLIIGIGLLYSIFSSFHDDIVTNESVIKLILIIVCGAFYYVLDNARIVEFDNDYMFISDKYGEEKIPLKDVYKIKYTMTQINKKNLWKISYYDKDKNEKSVRILPRTFEQNFDEFKNDVKEANDKLKIQNWSHSFDLDQ